MNSLEIKSMNVFIELNGVFTYVIGAKSSGKTFMLKKIMNKVNNEDVFINNKNIKDFDIDYLKRNIAVVLNDNVYHSEIVIDELKYYVNKLKLDVDFEKIIDFFQIKSLVDQSIDFTRLEDRLFIKIISLLIINPNVICIDGLFEYLSSKNIKLIETYIKDNNISLINVISNLEYLNFDSNIVILNNNTAIYCGDTMSVLKGNTILPYMGFKLPFIVDLSQNLVLYGLLNEVTTNEKKVVDQIWK